MIASMLLSVAWAQTPGQPGYQAPTVSAETYRPVVDAERSLITEHARVHRGWNARTELVWLHRPFSWVNAESGEVVDVLATAIGTNLSAAGAIGRFRLGATAPAWLLTLGDVHDGPAMALGDPTLDLKIGLVSEGPVGVALVGRAGTSLGAQDRQLGRGGAFWEGGAVTDLVLGDLQMAINAGLRGNPSQTLGEDAIDDDFWYRAATSWAVTDSTAVSLEGFGHLPFLAPDTSNTTPFELLAAVHHRPADSWGVHAGVGRGLTPGVGSPALRVVAGLSWRGSAASE